MNVLPVLERELRVQSRQAWTYWLRSVSALTLMAAGVLAGMELRGRLAGAGADLFGVVQPTLFSLIWIVAPLMTCDCLSKEKREGTLGLLLLTPLRAVDVTVAKGLSGVLQVFTLILAALPIMAIPFLMGGVSERDFLRAGLMDLMAVLGGVSAGLFASCQCREFSRSVLVSLMSSALVLLVVGDVQVHYFVTKGMFGSRLDGSAIFLLYTVGGWLLCSGVEGVWQAGPVATTPAILWVSALQAGLAAVGLLLTLCWANWRIRTSANLGGLTVRQDWWWRTLCSPWVFKTAFRRSMGWVLNRNPVGWLQCRTRSARLTTLGWMLGCVTVETVLISGWASDDLFWVQSWMVLVLVLAVGFSAATSFHQERETGALELLLVTPFSVRQILLGRLGGLGVQYGWPALFLIFFLWAFGLGDDDAPWLFGLVVLSVSALVSVSLTGLNQSLRCRSFLVAWPVTVFYSLVLPILGSLMVVSIFWYDLTDGQSSTYGEFERALNWFGVLAAFFQVVPGSIGWRRGRIALEQRLFGVRH